MVEVMEGVRAHVRQGGCLCVFPEGSVNREPCSLLPFRRGATVVRLCRRCYLSEDQRAASVGAPASGARLLLRCCCCCCDARWLITIGGAVARAL
jgi:hypothetical protein